jgi:hypothetical protein
VELDKKTTNKIKWSYLRFFFMVKKCVKHKK